MAEQKPESYVGVSGVAHLNEHVHIMHRAHEVGLDRLGRFAMIGVQATTKTQLQLIENSYGRDWHPVGQEIMEAAGNEDSGLTKVYVHCFFEPENLARGTELVMKRTLHFVRGLQLNLLPWMDQDFTDFINHYRASYPNMDIVLQAHADILERFKPDEVAAKLADLPVDYMLLDGSSGKGIEMDAVALRPFVDAIYQRQLPIGVVVAGGLEPSNLNELLSELLAAYPDLSFDAEGRLRTGEEGKTTLSLPIVNSYLRQAARVIAASRA